MPNPSIKIESGGNNAIYFTLFATVWNVCAWGLMPSSDAPGWVKILFMAVGLGLIAYTVQAWRARIRGGAAHMALANNPVPLGILTRVEWTLGKPWAQQPLQYSMSLHIEVEQRLENSSSWGQLWEQNFPVQISTPKQISASFEIPKDLPLSNNTNSDIATRMTLHIGKFSWPYSLTTRAASAHEIAKSLA